MGLSGPPRTNCLRRRPYLSRRLRDDMGRVPEAIEASMSSRSSPGIRGFREGGRGSEMPPVALEMCVHLSTRPKIRLRLESENDLRKIQIWEEGQIDPLAGSPPPAGETPVSIASAREAPLTRAA